MRTKPSHALSMPDRLSHLSFDEACKMLGPRGRRLLLEGGQLELDSDHVIEMDERQARVNWGSNGGACRIAFDPATRGKLDVKCTECRGPCVHAGAFLSLVLEHKSDLGLAAPPPERPAPVTGDEDIVAQALNDRHERAKTERMSIRSSDPSIPWTDYTVRSSVSGKSYRVALRSEVRGESYCSCPDFKTNTLGTCKHVMRVLAHIKKFPKEVRARRYRRTRITVHLRYDDKTSLAIALPKRLSEEAMALVEPLLGATEIRVGALLERLRELSALGQAFYVTPDAEEFIQRRLTKERLGRLVSDIREAPEKHPLRTTLLRVPLLPYQLDGIAFAAGSGRAIVADEMGLGKTIQGVGVAELLAREVGIRKVLVVCPASVKSQWRSEIQRFCERSTQLVVGPAKERARAYGDDTFFTICNYEQVLKDILHIEKTRWDLIILDEGQRIKNWEAKTTRVVKGLASRFALVLSGTPLENRLDDLFSVAAFVDPDALGPGFRFFHRHRHLDEKGKLVGYKNLDDLRARLAPILLRRTRESVRLELPPRTVEIVRIPPTGEQKELHDAHMQTVAQIVRKPFLTEMDLLRLRMALLMCRMAANSTFLVDKQPPGWSTKLERLEELIDGMGDEPGRKVILFSEWTTMLDLVEPMLEKRKLGFVRLDGSVPQKKRQMIVSRFQSDTKCRFFLTTNAGSTGLNLQAANTIINVDLPWNPAILEQRIGRAHRMGQTQPVHVFVLVTEETLEENLLATLASKRELALAALDPNSDVTAVDVRTQGEDLKQRLEILLGAKPDASVDETSRVDAEQAVDRARVVAAGSVLLNAAFSFLGELAGGPQAAERLRAELDPKVDEDEKGRARMSFAVPAREKIESLARGLLELMARAGERDATSAM